jgi:hypothetical protein
MVAPRLGSIPSLVVLLLVQLPARAVVVLVDALLATQPHSIGSSRFGGVYSRGSQRFGSSPLPLQRSTPDSADDAFEIPLLHILSTSDKEDSGQTMPIVPLPSDHLPHDPLLRRLHIYEIPTSSIPTLPMPSPTLIDLLVPIPDNASPPPTLFGFVAYIPTLPPSPQTLSPHETMAESLVGAIGCAVQVLNTSDDDDTDTASSSSSSSIWCQGRFRFVVHRIVQCEPYTVALVTKLYDDHNVNDEDDVMESTTTDHDSQQEDPEDDETEDEYDDDTHYDALMPDELEARTLQAMHACIDQQLVQAQERVAHPELWLLDETILDKFLALPASSSSSSSAQSLVDAAERQLAAAQEFTAAWHKFQSLLQSNVWPTPSERQFALALIAAELCRLDDATLRQRWLVTTNALERLRSVCACRTHRGLVARSSSSTVHCHQPHQCQCQSRRHAGLDRGNTVHATLGADHCNGYASRILLECRAWLVQRYRCGRSRVHRVGIHFDGTL